MRVWLIEQEACAGTQTSLEPLLRFLAQQHAPELVLAGVSGLPPDLPERTRLAEAEALVCNGVSWPEVADTTVMLSLGLPVLVAGACGSLEHWLQLAEKHTLGFVPVSAGAAEIWAALQSLRAGQRREESWRSQVQRLNQRLNDRIVIEKAKGLLMQKLGIGEEDAYKRLRVQSRRQRRQVREIAQSILDAQFVWDANGMPVQEEVGGAPAQPRRQRLDSDALAEPSHIVERAEE
jgi:hypothetical protein